MKAITWLASVALGAATLTSTSCNQKQAKLLDPTLPTASATALEGWTTDLEKAFVSAKAEKKAVLVEFTGSDWCPPCIAMRKNVFSKPEFIEAASKNYILVELDFPNGDPAVKAKNDPYAEKYKIEGFPTVILFSPEGKEFTRFFASEYPETTLFVEHINKALATNKVE